MRKRTQPARFLPFFLSAIIFHINCKDVQNNAVKIDVGTAAVSANDGDCGAIEDVRGSEKNAGPSMLKASIHANVAVFPNGSGSIIYSLTLENKGLKRLVKHEMTNQLDLRLIEKSYCQQNIQSRWSAAAQAFMNMNS